MVIKYPSWRYHATKPAIIVKDPLHEQDVAHPNEGWRDTPVDAEAVSLGPTFEEFVNRGYSLAGYPPMGCQARESPGWTAYQDRVRQEAEAALERERQADREKRATVVSDLPQTTEGAVVPVPEEVLSEPQAKTEFVGHIAPAKAKTPKSTKK